MSVKSNACSSRAKEVSPARVRSWLGELADIDRDLADAERIDLIRALEELTCGAAAPRRWRRPTSTTLSEPSRRPGASPPSRAAA